MAINYMPVPIAWLEPEAIMPGHFGQHMPGTFCECGVDDEDSGYNFMCNQPPLWLLIGVENPDVTVFVCSDHAWLYWDKMNGGNVRDWEWVNVLSWSAN